MKLIWHSYSVSSLDKCAHMKFSLRLFLRTRIMIDGIQLPLSAWLSCTTLGDSTNAMIVMATTNRALASPALGSVIADLVRRLPYACLVLWALASMRCLSGQAYIEVDGWIKYDTSYYHLFPLIRSYYYLFSLIRSHCRLFCSS